MTTRVLLIRHAETSDPFVFHGAESDIGLSDRGRRQADRLASYLAARRPDVLISSNMERARHTARPVAQLCKLEVQIEPELHERKVGQMGGLPTGQRDGPWMETVRRWIAGDTGFTLLGAESFDEMRDRVLPVWEQVTAQHAGKTIVIIAHGAIIKALLLTIVPGRGPADWLRMGPIQNVAVNELVSTGDGWDLVVFGERVVDDRPGAAW